jgi:DNA-binding HxlR family transcriptional regulator
MDLQQNKKSENTAPCPFREAMDLISGKWTISIINNLMTGKMRFKELERSVAGINTRMLVKELKELESKQIIYREAFATVPPTVEYSLTEKGKALRPVLIEVQKWALNNPLNQDQL